MNSSIKPTIALLSLAALTMLAGATGCSATSSDDVAEAKGAATVTPATHADIASVAGELRDAIDPSHIGHHQDVEDLEGSSPLDVLKSLAAKLHEGESNNLAHYTYSTNATKFVTDDMVAGIFASPAATKAAIITALRNADNENAPFTSALEATVSEKIDTLAAAGAVFAFDGMQQNGCATGTAFLAVIDTKHNTAFGIDLTPCEE